jgi:hypothetical protein
LMRSPTLQLVSFLSVDAGGSSPKTPSLFYRVSALLDGKPDALGGMGTVPILYDGYYHSFFVECR